MKAISLRKWVRFTFRGEPGSKVFVAGAFNKWNPMEVKLKDREKNGIYETLLLLNVGRHEYKFMVNGIWQLDPACADFAANAFGSLNSVINVAYGRDNLEEARSGS